MKRFTFFCFVLCLLTASFDLSAGQHYGYDNPFDIRQMKQRIVCFGIFNRPGSFAGNTTIVLSDGSEWKVHPKDQALCRGWLTNDIVHVGVRQSFYFFKREHKFYLCNETGGGKEIRVMLVCHADYPLAVLKKSKAYPTATLTIPVYTYVYNPQTGETDSFISHYEQMPSDYYQDLQLSDGSVWQMRQQPGFNAGSVVYFCYSKEKSRYMLIEGYEKAAEWTYVYPKL